MFFGYNGSARRNFGWSLIHAALFKKPMFVILIDRIVMAHLPEETDSGRNRLCERLSEEMLAQEYRRSVSRYETATYQI
jgi:hypothetical protein